MKATLDIGVVGILVLMMGAVGMELEGRHFRAVARRKGALLLTLAAQAVLLPALGVGLAYGLALPPQIRAGLLLVAACPVGDLANFYTLLARANVALSVTLNTLSILLSAATMAGVFAGYGHLLGARVVFAGPPLTLFLRLTLLLVLPLLAGMALRHLRPAFVARHGRTVRHGFVAAIVGLCAFVLVTQRAQVAAEWQQTVGAAAGFMAVALLAGLALGRLLQLPTADSVTVGIGFAVRNVALAMAIAVTLLHHAVFVVVYFLIEVLLLGAAAVYRTWGTPAEQRNVVPGNPSLTR